MVENENNSDDTIKRRIAEVQAERSRLFVTGARYMTPADLRTLRRITVELMTLVGAPLAGRTDTGDGDGWEPVQHHRRTNSRPTGRRPDRGPRRA